MVSRTMPDLAILTYRVSCGQQLPRCVSNNEETTATFQSSPRPPTEPNLRFSMCRSRTHESTRGRRTQGTRELVQLCCLQGSEELNSLPENPEGTLNCQYSRIIQRWAVGHTCPVVATMPLYCRSVKESWGNYMASQHTIALRQSKQRVHKRDDRGSSQGQV